MNADPRHQGMSSFLAAFGLAALPPEIYNLTVRALGADSTMTDIHKAASAIANEAPVTCLQGVISTLLYLGKEQGTHVEGVRNQTEPTSGTAGSDKQAGG